MEHEFQIPFEENSKCNISENEVETFSLIVKMKEKLLENENIEKQHMSSLNRLMYEIDHLNFDFLEQDKESSDDTNNSSNECPDLDYVTMHALISIYNFNGENCIPSESLLSKRNYIINNENLIENNKLLILINQKILSDFKGNSKFEKINLPVKLKETKINNHIDRLFLQTFIITTINYINEWLCSNKKFRRKKNEPMFQFQAEIFDELYREFNITNAICNLIENDFIIYIESFKLKHKIDFHLTELFSEIFWDIVFKIKVLANKYVNLYVKLAKMEENNNNSLCKIMDIVFGFERSCLKDLCKILDIEHIVNKHNKRFLSDYIVDYKAEKKVKKEDEIESSLNNVDKTSDGDDISFIEYNTNLILNTLTNCNNKINENNECKCLKKKKNTKNTNSESNTNNTSNTSNTVTPKSDIGLEVLVLDICSNSSNNNSSKSKKKKKNKKNKKANKNKSTQTEDKNENSNNNNNTNNNNDKKHERREIIKDNVVDNFKQLLKNTTKVACYTKKINACFSENWLNLIIQ